MQNKYCFIKNINDNNEINTKIKDVITHPESYIFIKTSSIHIIL